MQIIFEPRPSGICREPNVPLRRLIEKEYFRPADTKLTYRQIDLLRYAGLLEEAANGKWKKFDTKDLIYLQVVSELKRFGFENTQLEGIKQLFYSEKDWGVHPYGRHITNVMDYVLFEIFHGVEWTLLVKPNGDIVLCNRSKSFLAVNECVSCVHLNLLALIARVALTVTGGRDEQQKVEPMVLLIEGLLRDEKFDELGREFLSVLKDKKYREITIVKKDGDEVVIEAKNTKNSTSPDILHALTSIEGHDFQKIEVLTRKKKPVCYAYTDIFKGKYLKALEKSS